MEKIPCTVGILTLNSASFLERCLDSVRDFAEIIVLDGNSTDRTREIAARFGARIVTQEGATESNHRIQDFARVHNQLFSLATQAWYLDLDSDEYLSDELRERIRQITAAAVTEEVAYNIPRLAIVEGRPVRYAFFYPDLYIRLYRPSRGYRFHPKKILHEKLLIPEGVTVRTLEEPVCAPWGSVEDQEKKDVQYLGLVRAKQTSRRSFSISILLLSSTFRNIALAANIVLRTFIIALRHPREERLPWKYVKRFVKYHLSVACIRFRHIFSFTKDAGSASG